MPQRLAWLLGAVALLTCIPIGATVYVPMADESLADQAPIIAEVEIVTKLPPRWTEVPSTEYLATVTRVLKGSLSGSSITVQVPGGERPDGSGLMIWGLPSFEPGDTVLLFLEAEQDGTHGILHWSLGTFRIIESGGRQAAVRDLREAQLLPGQDQHEALSLRDYEKFASWLEARARGRHRLPDYYVEGDASSLISPYALFSDQGIYLRWFEFHEGGKVTWIFPEEGWDGGAEVPLAFEKGMRLWNSDSETPIRLDFTFGDPGTLGLNGKDKKNAILFGDPNKTLPGKCSGGILEGTVARTHVEYEGFGLFNEETYRKIVDTDIVIHRDVKCFYKQYGGAAKAAAYLAAHELGHSLGIDHSDKGQPPEYAALMVDLGKLIDNFGPKAARKRVRRGASLEPDDIAALHHLYKEKIKRPTKLNGKATSETTGMLHWKDNSSNETAFEVWLKTVGKNWIRWRTKTAEKIAASSEPFSKAAQPGLECRTDFCTDAMGNYLYCPEDYPYMDHCQCHCYRTHDAATNNCPNGATRCRDYRGRTVSLNFKGMNPGQTYRFKVRAIKTSNTIPTTDGRLGGQKAKLKSKFSNVARVTMPEKLRAPSNLRASATSSIRGKLSWKDNSNNETAFEVWLKTSGRNWSLWRTKAANTTGIDFTDANPGQTYHFKVRARKGSKRSPFSNVASVTMPEEELRRPTNMRASATSNTEGRLTWNDNSNNETAFEIWIKVGGGPWNSWSTKSANTTGTGFRNASPGQTYRFKVRAKKGQKASAFSNVATVTMPIGRRDCGSFTCRADYACCARYRTCCRPEYPHYCPNTNKCYRYFTGAQAACGNSWEVCGGAVAGLGSLSGSFPSGDSGFLSELFAIGQSEVTLSSPSLSLPLSVDVPGVVALAPVLDQAETPKESPSCEPDSAVLLLERE